MDTKQQDCYYPCMQNALRPWTFELLMLGVIMLIGNGCIVITEDLLEPVSTFPETSTKKSVIVEWDGRLENMCIRRLKRSGLFAEVSEDTTAPALKLDVSMRGGRVQKKA